MNCSENILQHILDEDDDLGSMDEDDFAFLVDSGRPSCVHNEDDYDYALELCDPSLDGIESLDKIDKQYFPELPSDTNQSKITDVEQGLTPNSNKFGLSEGLQKSLKIVGRDSALTPEQFLQNISMLTLRREWVESAMRRSSATFQRLHSLSDDAVLEQFHEVMAVGVWIRRHQIGRPAITGRLSSTDGCRTLLFEELISERNYPFFLSEKTNLAGIIPKIFFTNEFKFSGPKLKFGGHGTVNDAMKQAQYVLTSNQASAILSTDEQPPVPVSLSRSIDIESQARDAEDVSHRSITDRSWYFNVEEAAGVSPSNAERDVTDIQRENVSTALPTQMKKLRPANRLKRACVFQPKDIIGVHPAECEDPSAPGQLGSDGFRLSADAHCPSLSISVVYTTEDSQDVRFLDIECCSLPEEPDGSHIAAPAVDPQELYFTLLGGLLLVMQRARSSRELSELPNVPALQRSSITWIKNSHTADEGDASRFGYRNQLRRWTVLNLNGILSHSRPNSDSAAPREHNKDEDLCGPQDRRRESNQWAHILSQNNQFKTWRSVGTQIIARLFAAGLEVKCLSSCDRRSVIFKIRCPQWRLEEVAESLRLKLRLRTGEMRRFKVSKRNSYVGVGVTRGRGLFRSVERQRVIDYILRSKVADGGAELDEGSELGYHIAHRFPLHMYSRLEVLRHVWVTFWKSEPVGTVSGPWSPFTTPLKETVRRLIFSVEWFGANLLKQPLDGISEYFGEGIAFYFVWLDFYTRWLIVPAFLGVIVFMCQVFERRLDHPVCIPFAIFIMFWAAVMLAKWRQRASILAHRWGVLGFELKDEADRPEYRGTPEHFQTMKRHRKLNQQVKRPDCGDFEEPTFWTRFRRYAVTVPMVLVCIVLVLTILFSMISTQDTLVRNYLNGHESLLLVSHGTTTKNSTVVNNSFLTISDAALEDSQFWMICFLFPFIICTFIGISVVLFNKFAVTLNWYENHRTDSTYRNGLVLKIFSFRFVTVFTSLYFYIIFFDRSESAYLRVIATVFGLMTVGVWCDKFLDTCVPAMWKRITSIRRKSALQKLSNEILLMQLQPTKSGDDLLLIENKAALLEQSRSDCWQEASLPDFDITESYSILTVQTCFIFMFSGIFPLGPLLALLNNLFLIRIDAYRLTHVCKRPIARKLSGLGVWENVLQFSSVLGILTSCFVMGYTSSILQVAWAAIGPGGIAVVLFFIEHLVLLFKYWLLSALPRIPSTLFRYIRDETKKRRKGNGDEWAIGPNAKASNSKKLPKKRSAHEFNKADAPSEDDDTPAPVHSAVANALSDILSFHDSNKELGVARVPTKPGKLFSRNPVSSLRQNDDESLAQDTKNQKSKGRLNVFDKEQKSAAKRVVAEKGLYVRGQGSLAAYVDPESKEAGEEGSSQGSSDSDSTIITSRKSSLGNNREKLARKAQLIAQTPQKLVSTSDPFNRSPNRLAQLACLVPFSESHARSLAAKSKEEEKDKPDGIKKEVSSHRKLERDSWLRPLTTPETPNSVLVDAQDSEDIEPPKLSGTGNVRYQTPPRNGNTRSFEGIEEKAENNILPNRDISVKSDSILNLAPLGKTIKKTESTQLDENFEFPDKSRKEIDEGYKQFDVDEKEKDASRGPRPFQPYLLHKQLLRPVEELGDVRPSRLSPLRVIHASECRNPSPPPQLSLPVMSLPVDLPPRPLNKRAPSKVQPFRPDSNLTAIIHVETQPELAEKLPGGAPSPIRSPIESRYNFGDENSNPNKFNPIEDSNEVNQSPPLVYSLGRVLEGCSEMSPMSDITDECRRRNHSPPPSTAAAAQMTMKKADSRELLTKSPKVQKSKGVFEQQTNPASPSTRWWESPSHLSSPQKRAAGLRSKTDKSLKNSPSRDIINRDLISTPPTPKPTAPINNSNSQKKIPAVPTSSPSKERVKKLVSSNQSPDKVAPIPLPPTSKPITIKMAHLSIEPAASNPFEFVRSSPRQLHTNVTCNQYNNELEETTSKLAPIHPNSTTSSAKIGNEVSQVEQINQGLSPTKDRPVLKMPQSLRRQSPKRTNQPVFSNPFSFAF